MQKALVDQQAAVMILDKDLTGKLLSQNILDLYQNQGKKGHKWRNVPKKAGKRDALAQIIRLVEQYC